MLLTKRQHFKPDEKTSIILGHMGYAAVKLWNVGNYEKRHYKELGMEYPNWYEQKKRLKDNFFYKNLPAQTAQDVLQQLEEGFKSFFSLSRKHPERNPQMPRFKKGKMDITFKPGAIKQENGQIRLTIPSQLKTYLRKEKGVDADYLCLKIRRFSELHIKELQICFLPDGTMEALAVYEVPDVPVLPENNRYLSIDLGIKNTFTCYDSAGYGFIVKGFLEINHYYNKRVAYFQNISDREQAAKGVKHPKKSAYVKHLYGQYRSRVYDFIHKSTRYIVDYCRENDIHTVIIGDMKGIREGKNLGRTNQSFHAFPSAKIYDKLEYKLALYGIRMVKKKENYSSQCPPDSEKVSKKYAEPKNRVKRGCYVHNGVTYNADMVGAYNIYRLYMQDKKRNPVPHLMSLRSPRKVTVS